MDAPADGAAAGANNKNLTLLVQLRWLAVVGQILTILVVNFGLGVALPLGEMVAVVLFLVGLNAVSLLRLRRAARVSDPELFIELMLDVAALTVQLYLSGGATNPFISLYLLQVILAAVLLRSWAVWSVVVLAAAGFIALTFHYRPIALPHAHGGDFFNLHIQGMFICFALASVLVVVFVGRIQANLQQRDSRLAELRQQAAEEDHIVRMGLLASGAAHELGTPLATISVILGDWQRHPALAADAELAAEMTEMQSGLDRCKAIVSGILMSAGDVRGEGTLRGSVRSFFDECLREFRASRSVVAVEFDCRFTPDVAIVYDAALKQVVFNVLDNALEASPYWVGVTVDRAGDAVILSVEDVGAGFADDVLTELGRPYRSTKGRPGGGLGLFLVVNVVRKLGGRFVAGNRVEGGGHVVLTLPLAALVPREIDVA